MKRLHVSLTVANLDASIRFYSTLFGVAPTVRKADYAKWMLDDPRVNFAIDTGGLDGVAGPVGVSHVGMQAETEEELAEIYGRIAAAGGPSLDEGDTTCCYARSTKQWIEDPDGVAWEAFLTHEDAPHHGGRGRADATPAATVSTAADADAAATGDGAHGTGAGGGCCR